MDEDPCRNQHTLRDALVVQTLDAIKEHAKQSAAALAALAQASFENSKAMAKLIEVLQVDRRVTVLETRDTEQQAAMDRHREEHKSYSAKFVGALVAIISTLAVVVATLWSQLQDALRTLHPGGGPK